MKDEVLIKFPDENESHFTIAQGDKYHEGLSWGEMVEQVIGLTHPQIKRPQYSMKSRRLQDAEKAFVGANRILRDAQNAECAQTISQALNYEEAQPSPVAETAAKEAVRLGHLEE